MKIIDFLYGKVTLAFPVEVSKTLFDILRRSGANYEDIRISDNDLSVCMPKRDFDKLNPLFHAYEIEYRIAKEQGLYLFFRSTAKRPGLYLGFIIFLSVLFLQTNFVFDIRIGGNEILTDREVLAELEREGFQSGSYLPSIDIETLCNRLVLHSDKISWISVNMVGTIAYVEVKEKQDKVQTQPDTGLSCLVAERDGVIVGFECTTGKIAVNVGETVRAGQVLVNGVSDTALGTYFGNAAGAVRARTSRAFSVTIPKSEEIITGYTRTKKEKSIIFLGKSIKVFTKGGNLPSTCDTIQSETVQLSLSPDLLLPIHLKTTYCVTPIKEIVTHTEEEAYRLANEDLNEQITELIGCQILRTETEWTENEDSYILTKKLICIENIAKKVPITTN